MEDKIEKIAKDIQEQIDVSEVENIIQNNVNEFSHNDEEYRIRPITYSERQKIYKLKLDKYTELLRDEDNLLDDDLKKIYLKRGIDVDAMTAEIITLDGRKRKLKEDLGKALKNKTSEKELEILKREILDLEQSQVALSVKKTNLMQSSIESRVLVYIYQYLTFLITEKKVEDKWVRAWNSYDDFVNSADEVLINRASFTASVLIGQI